MESQFTAKDFSGFKYQRIVSSKVEVLKSYPELKKYKEFDPKLYKKMRLSYDKIFRYVLLAYTNNILLESIPEMTKRKRESAILAGFGTGKGVESFSGDVEEIIKCNIPLVNELIILVIRLNKDGEYQQLLAFEEARASQISNMINGDGRDATAVLMENIRKLSAYIENLRNNILNQDEQPDIIELLYENIITENLGIKPEDIAQARKDGNLDKILKKPRP